MTTIISTSKSRGKYKQKINSALMNCKPIKDLLLGDVQNKTPKEIRTLFKQHVKSHLFVDDTITDKSSYIFFDVIIPRINNTTKSCEIVMYAICHRDILDDIEQDGYFGNRADILSEMIEDCLIYDNDVSKQFGIGEIRLKKVGLYNSKTLYGTYMEFDVADFR